MDGIFFLDLPGRAEKEAIWRLYLARYGLEPDQRRPADRDWTRAEIAACCRLAALLDVPLIESAQNIVPVAVTAGESVERLRQWASGRCLDADRPGLYTRGGTATDSPAATSAAAIRRRTDRRRRRSFPTRFPCPLDAAGRVVRRLSFSTEAFVTTLLDPIDTRHADTNDRPPPTPPRPPGGCAPPWPPAGWRSPGGAPRRP